jgi:hypothetical protein
MSDLKKITIIQKYRAFLHVRCESAEHVISPNKVIDKDGELYISTQSETLTHHTADHWSPPAWAVA